MNRVPTCKQRMQMRKDEKKTAGGFSLRYMTGASAVALVCCCLLYLIFLAVPAHASVGNGSVAALIPLDTSTPSPTDTTTPSPTVTDTPSPTDTTTPSPTVTNTPSPSPTNPTTTPVPSPSATRTVSPSPTTAATPTSTQAAGTSQGPADSPTPAAQTDDSSQSGSNPLADALPLILVGLGAIVLLPLLFIPVRILLRKGLVPLPSPKLPP